MDYFYTFVEDMNGQLAEMLDTQRDFLVKNLKRSVEPIVKKRAEVKALMEEKQEVEGGAGWMVNSLWHELTPWP